LDIDNYSAIVAVGGDGTIHEVINGLMRRQDGKKLPVAFLPNGSGNDACGSIECDTLDQGLDYIIKGNVIKIDIFEALLDHESAAEVLEKESLDEENFKAHEYLRYCVINTSLCIVG